MQYSQYSARKSSFGPKTKAKISINFKKIRPPAKAKDANQLFFLCGLTFVFQPVTWLLLPPPEQGKIIFFLWAQPGDKRFLQTNAPTEYFLCTRLVCGLPMSNIN
jgi:hypothetical protein